MKRQSFVRADTWVAMLAVAAAFLSVQGFRPPAASGRSPALEPIALPAVTVTAVETKLASPARRVFGRSGDLKVLFAMPGETVEFPLEVPAGDTTPLFYEWTSLRGIETAFSAQPLLDSTVFTPNTPGFYYLTLVRGDTRQMLTEPVMAVMRPFEEKSGTMLNGYRIGTYIAEQPRRERAVACPVGFLEVYPQHVDLPISRHFRVRDFITHDDQVHVWPKYVALDPRLVDKLELVLTHLETRRGAHVDRDLRFNVHSGFRTPAYNKRVRRAARDSRHQYGEAADIGVDANWNGRIDRTDWRAVVTAVETVERTYPDLLGGLGVYNSRRYTAPFVHIDVRGKRSRWKG